MLILIYFFIMNEFLPRLGAYAEASLQTVMVALIILTGIVMMLGAVGLKVSNNLGSTIVSNIFKGINYFGKTVINAIGWVIRQIVQLIPRLFKRSRQTFLNKGMSALVSNIFASVIVLVVLIIII